MNQEIYFLGHSRSREAVESFICEYLERPYLLMDPPFHIPELSDNPRVVFECERELLDFLAVTVDECYGLYWGDKTSSNQAMAFFTLDGCIIFGVAGFFENAVIAMENIALRWKFQFYRLGWEQQPPDSAEEFRLSCKTL